MPILLSPENKPFGRTYLFFKILFSSICTLTPIRPRPSPNTGKKATQFAFSSKSLPCLTEIHCQWYIWSEILTKFTKIVPLNIAELLKPIGLLNWIIGDGYWSQTTLYLCTDNFTSEEVDLLISVLQINFGLIAGKTVELKIYVGELDLVLKRNL
jgi:LAGLIDADG DNA endonuclease family